MADPDRSFQYFVNMSKAFASLCGGDTIWLMTKNPGEPGWETIPMDTIFLQFEFDTMKDHPYKLSPQSVEDKWMPLRKVC